MFGLGLPEWLTILGLVGGLYLTFRVMAKAAVAYERRRTARESALGSRGITETGEHQ